MASTRSFRGVRIIRFGEFEFDVRAAELRKDQHKIRLQEQPFRILVMLLEHPGEVVMREEIRTRLWPNGTVVEVGHGINAAVQRLREALGDSAENPRYVETLARRGYRFTCPVETVHKTQTEPADPAGSSDFTGDLSGKTISHYQVLEKLGGGGMGVVYRAQDLKLGRYVALKFLPQELAGEPIARGRFQREARAASALNHPNICTIYGVEECAGQLVIVMELLEGETLERRLLEGPLPPDRALALAIQMAAALDTAHRKGVVHRDLKPANVLLTNSGLKVLDFGLAKMEGAPGVYGSGYGGVYRTPAHVTREGAVLGTLHYMSPEQVQGKETGAASDIFSLGAVLYEMLSGRRAFGGENPALAIAAILTTEPPALADSVAGPTLDRVLRRCLAKDPEDRWQTARDLKAALEWIAARPPGLPHPAPPPPHLTPPPRHFVQLQKLGHRGWMAAGAFGITLVLLLSWVALPRWRGPSPGGKVTRFTVTSPVPGGILRLNLSPNGRRLAFVAGGRLHVRSFDSSETRVLEGTEGSGTPFWSPDSRYLAFAAAGKLKLVDTVGGPTRILADVNTNLGGSWSDDGTILIGLVGDGLYRVPAAGGPLTRLTELDRMRDESRHLMPQFLPGGRRFLFVAGATKAGQTMLYAGSLVSRERVPIMPVESNVMFVPYGGDPLMGRLVFLRGRVLMAQSFDAAKLRVEGEAFPIAESVIANNAIGAEVRIGEFSAAGGALAYRPSPSRTGIPVSFNLRPSGSSQGLSRPAPSAGGVAIIQNWTAAVRW